MEHIIENIILSILLTQQYDQVMWFKHLSKSKQDMLCKQKGKLLGNEFNLREVQINVHDNRKIITTHPLIILSSPSASPGTNCWCWIPL